VLSQRRRHFALSHSATRHFAFLIHHFSKSSVFKLAKSESLFQILLRQPWWITLLVAVAVFGVSHAVFPPVAAFMALPFGLLSAYIAFKQWRSGAPGDAGERLAALRSMDWDEFSSVITGAYRRGGYEVSPAAGPGYDFRLSKGGRVTLLQCRRWKVNQVGVGPLRDLARAVEREEAANGVCVSAGDFSAPARAFIATEPITLLGGGELAALVGAIRESKPS
jgi:restriction system protein